MLVILVLSVSLQQAEYEVAENEGEISVCVETMIPSVMSALARNITLTLSSVEDTATGIL